MNLVNLMNLTITQCKWQPINIHKVYHIVCKELEKRSGYLERFWMKSEKKNQLNIKLAGLLRNF